MDPVRDTLGEVFLVQTGLTVKKVGGGLLSFEKKPAKHSLFLNFLRKSKKWKIRHIFELYNFLENLQKFFEPI
jgi:hypothetical protein